MADQAYRQLWAVVDGAVNDAFYNHADYLTQQGRRSARVSLVKRVTGTVLSFAVQAAERQRKLAATDDHLGPGDRQAAAGVSGSAGAGVVFRQPIDTSLWEPEAWKRPRYSRYRLGSKFAKRTAELCRAVDVLRLCESAVGEALHP